jgi:dienelactone hydrolase
MDHLLLETSVRAVAVSTKSGEHQQFAYDPSPLDVREEGADTTERWIRQRVSFTSAKGGDRVPAFLFLPRHGTPPFQTVVYFPGSTSLTWRSLDQLNTLNFDFLLDDGRAVIFPMYLGTFERDVGIRFSDPDSSHAHRERVVRWQQEVSRTVDFIGTRADLDSSKVAFLGYSWGGRFGGIVLATEPRIKAGLLIVAGLNFRRPQPEVDDLHYLPRVRTPVLMVNGRYDTTFPLNTAAEPMYRFLGTAPEHKRHVIVEGQHYVPRNDLIRESLAWLETYLGPVRR